MNTFDAQFSRNPRRDEHNYWDNIAYAYIIIGLGRIGGYVCQKLADRKNTNTIILFDDDIVEAVNLNGSVFKYEDLNFKKVEICAKNAITKNAAVNMIPIPLKFKEETVDNISLDNRFMYSFPKELKYIVFDCRDNDYQDYNLLKKFNIDYEVYRLAYNGYWITLDIHPERHPVHGQMGYAVIPSDGKVADRVASLGIDMAHRNAYDGYYENKGEDGSFTFHYNAMCEMIPEYPKTNEKFENVTA